MTADALNPNLAAYLDEVTAPFPEDSAARIRADLTAHVLDAAAPGGAGMQEALAALGPAAEVRAALEGQFFTRADVAWLERDGKMRRLLTDGVKGPGTAWTALLGSVAGVGVLTWLVCGWPGVPAPFALRPFTWVVPALLALQFMLVLIDFPPGMRRPARSVAGLRRVSGTLMVPLGFALNLLVFVPGVVSEPALLAAALGAALLWAYLTRPREALTLAGKAWRGAR
ncbi:hypothetical protein [Deinococcus soli (ex Cha et al. 2016)]|uniref:Uncharacterized protein n=2 Tax=Deinococcus soli (ex Cha et al. 2016) TaxID=1309411 RepID=A0ACC6KJL6_9DEIO|nr:hypothetical protein [Deinococcus soli (ex Cha et al. 2016)]MDR6219747.1 hypothetical protein [Deinococcus soli (ex Cha et al. 2016)]MDR6329653.1 hypothetical protein [Deinococcus soli (ex Cha et al. 2016)]MDR6752654.1 hypothetical protein [Deinococcus soli (ex Cha et al. 2016)]